MTDEIREAMDFAREQAELAVRNQDRSVCMKVIGSEVSVIVDILPEEDFLNE